MEHEAYILDHYNDLYQLLSYIERFASLYVDVEKNISKVKELFSNIESYSISEICSSVINLLTLTASGAPADFKFLGTTIPRKRYGSPQSILSSTLIHQSITGLYETRIDLSQLGGD